MARPMTHFRTCLKREGRSGRRARLKGDREWEERNGAAVCSGTTAQSSTWSRPGKNAANVRKSETDKARRQTERLQKNIGKVVAATEEAVSAQLDGPASERQDRRKMELRRRRNKQRLAAVVAAAIIIIALGFSAGRILVLKHDLHVAEKQQQEYIEEKEQLQNDLAEIDDKSNLEEQARNQMRLIRPEETLYIFPEEMTEQTEPTEPTDEE